MGCASSRKAARERFAGLRQGMGFYVNVRPVKVLEPLRGMSPLKADRLGDLDLEIIRELAGGMYFGERGSTTENGVERAWDTERTPPRKSSGLRRLPLCGRRIGRGGCVRWTRPTF